MSNRLWIVQNSLWIKCLTAAVTLGILLTAFAVQLAPKIVSYAWLQIGSGRPSLVEIEAQISREEQLSEQLRKTLDSARALSTHTDQEVLFSIQRSCRSRGISILGYDRVASDPRAKGRTVSYRLSLEGQFREFAVLLADFESNRPRLVVKSLSLESRMLGQDFLRGLIVVETGD